MAWEWNWKTIVGKPQKTTKQKDKKIKKQKHHLKERKKN